MIELEKTIGCRCLSLAALLLVVAGCVNVDYVGQTFSPIPEGTPVQYFTARKEVPPGKYRIIGRAVVTTSRKFDKYDVREFLVDEARKRGADAVVLVYSRRIKRGVYEREVDEPAIDIAPASKATNIKPGGGDLKVSLDPADPLEGEHHYRVELKLRALFLRNKEDLEQQLARRGRELDQLVKQPDPAKQPEAEPDRPAAKR